MEASQLPPTEAMALTADAGQPSNTRMPVRRAYKACLWCRSRKCKCDLGDLDSPSEPPCSRCRREGRECLFVESRRGQRSKSAALVPTSERADKLDPPSVGKMSVLEGKETTPTFNSPAYRQRSSEWPTDGLPSVSSRSNSDTNAPGHNDVRGTSVPDLPSSSHLHLHGGLFDHMLSDKWAWPAQNKGDLAPDDNEKGVNRGIPPSDTRRDDSPVSLDSAACLDGPSSQGTEQAIWTRVCSPEDGTTTPYVLVDRNVMGWEHVTSLLMDYVRTMHLYLVSQ